MYAQKDNVKIIPCPGMPVLFGINLFGGMYLSVMYRG